MKNYNKDFIRVICNITKILLLSVSFCSVFSCITASNYIEREYVLSGEEIDDILIYNVRMDKMITMIELFIEGEISGKISLVFKEKENEYEFPQILTGNFTRKFLHDWYSSQCIIKLIPENESVSGIIKIKTRIFN